MLPIEFVSGQYHWPEYASLLFPPTTPPSNLWSHVHHLVRHCLRYRRSCSAIQLWPQEIYTQLVVLRKMRRDLSTKIILCKVHKKLNKVGTKQPWSRYKSCSIPTTAHYHLRCCYQQEAASTSCNLDCRIVPKGPPLGPLQYFCPSRHQTSTLCLLPSGCCIGRRILSRGRHANPKGLVSPPIGPSQGFTLPLITHCVLIPVGMHEVHCRSQLLLRLKSYLMLYCCIKESDEVICADKWPGCCEWMTRLESYIVENSPQRRVVYLWWCW